MSLQLLKSCIYTHAIFVSCSAWMAQNQQPGCSWGWQIFQWANGFLTGSVMPFFTAPRKDPSVLWIIHISLPCHNTTSGTFHLCYHKKDPLHLCPLSFAWLYMDSMDMLFMGTGVHFYSHQTFVLQLGPPPLLFHDKKRLFCF